MPEVHVTESHIEAGLPGLPELCPVALAIKETLPGRHVKVLTNMLMIEGERFKVPKQVLGFIEQFDLGGPEYVTTFSFHTEDLELQL